MEKIFYLLLMLAVPLSIPSDPLLVGLVAYLQGALLDTSPGSPVPVGLTDALEIEILQ